jgi:hypothetical protein
VRSGPPSRRRNGPCHGRPRSDWNARAPAGREQSRDSRAGRRTTSVYPNRPPKVASRAKKLLAGHCPSPCSRSLFHPSSSSWPCGISLRDKKKTAMNAYTSLKGLSTSPVDNRLGNVQPLASRLPVGIVPKEDVVLFEKPSFLRAGIVVRGVARLGLSGVPLISLHLRGAARRVGVSVISGFSTTRTLRPLKSTTFRRALKTNLISNHATNV